MPHRTVGCWQHLFQLERRHAGGPLLSLQPWPAVILCSKLDVGLSTMCRRATVSLAFVPIFMGSAYKNKGVQLLLDGVSDYLPSPCQVENTALVR